MKKLNRHEKLSIILGIIAIILLVISCCPGGYEQATGILQGIATGFISGVVLFLVSATKSREEKEIADIREDLIIMKTYFCDISDTISSLNILLLTKIENGKFIYINSFSKEFLSLYHNLKEINKNAPLEKMITTMPSSQSVYTTLGKWLRKTKDSLKKEVKKIDPSFRGAFFEDYLSFYEKNTDATSFNDFLYTAYYNLNDTNAAIYHARNSVYLQLREIEKQQKRINNSVI